MAESSGAVAGNAVAGLVSHVLGIDWSEHFPLQIGDVVVRLSDYDEAKAFFCRNSDAIYGAEVDHPFVSEGFTAARERYYRAAGDFFAFVHRMAK